jgi:hypothetical protein
VTKVQLLLIKCQSVGLFGYFFFDLFSENIQKDAANYTRCANYRPIIIIPSTCTQSPGTKDAKKEERRSALRSKKRRCATSCPE